MKLPLLEALESRVIRHVPLPGRVPPRIFSVETGTSLSVAGPRDGVEFEVMARIGFRQVGPAGAERIMRENATAAISRQVYGPIAEELMGLREGFWEMGIRAPDKPMVRLNEMIGILLTGRSDR